MLARIEKSVRALFCVFQAVFMRAFGSFPTRFSTVFNIAKGRKLQSYSVVTGLLRIVFLRVFQASFLESFGRLSAGICKHFGKSVDSRTATLYNKNRPETITESGRFGVPDWIRTNGLSLRRRPLYPAELRGQKPISNPILHHFCKKSSPRCEYERCPCGTYSGVERVCKRNRLTNRKHCAMLKPVRTNANREAVSHWLNRYLQKYVTDTTVRRSLPSSWN